LLVIDGFGIFFDGLLLVLSVMQIQQEALEGIAYFLG
jgi:hypothetical protein